MPIIFRPHRSTLNEAMVEAKVFNTKEEMFNYIVSCWKGSFDVNDLVIDDKENADNRIGWLDTHYVCTKRFGNKIYDEPQCIGMCATKFPHTSKCPHYKKNDSICFKCNNVAYNFDSELDYNTSGVINGEIPLKSGADNKDGFKDKVEGDVMSNNFNDKWLGVLGLSAVGLSKYIVSKCYLDGCPVTNVELQCLLYIIQRKFLACYMIAFYDDFEAWAFGAVVPNSYYRFCGFGAMPITPHINYEINIEEKRKKFLDLIIETYRGNDPFKLIDEVKIPNGAWETIYNNKNGKKIIPIELIEKDAITRGEIA